MKEEVTFRHYYVYCAIVVVLKQIKKCSHCLHKLWYFKSYIFGTLYRRPWIFQTMNSVRSNNLSFKYQRLTSSVCKDIRIINLSLWQRLNSFTNRCSSFTTKYKYNDSDNELHNFCVSGSFDSLKSSGPIVPKSLAKLNY